MRKTRSESENKEEKEGDDRFTKFVYAVFVVVVLGAGQIIMSLMKDNSTLDKRVTLLEYKCLAPLLPQPAHP